MSDQSKYVESCLSQRRDFLYMVLAAPALLPALVATPSIASDGNDLLDDPDSARRYDALFKHVHPNVQYRYRPLSDAKNAWSLWVKAKKKLQPTPNLETDPQLYDDAHSGFNEGPFPPGNRGKKLISWLDKNLPALELVDQGIARGQVQIPLGSAKAAIDAMNEYIEVIRGLADVRQLLIKRLLSQDKLDEAADQIDKLFEFARLLAEHETYLIYRLVAYNFVENAALGMRLWASHRNANADRLRRWIGNLIGLVPTAESTAQVMRVEFCCYWLAALAAIRPSKDTSQLAQSLLDQFLFEFAFDDASKKAANEDRELRKGVLIRLLKGHPKPLDAEATVRAASLITARAIEDLSQPWRRRTKVFNRAARDEVAFWPIALSFLNDAYIVFREDPPKDDRKSEDFTEREISELSKKIHAMDNPVGRLLIAYTTDYDLYRPQGFETRLQALRLVLGIRLFEMVRGKRPATLSALVDSKCIEALPLDPYAAAPFSYSQERGVVWSVGDEGKGNGKFVPTNEWDKFNEESLSWTWRVLSPRGN